MSSEILGHITRSAVLLLSLTAMPSGTAAAHLYSCTILQGGQLSDDGYIRESNMTKAIVKSMWELIFDPKNQTLFWNKTTYRFEIVQQPSPGNGLVAIRVYQGPASVVVQQLRIRTLSDGLPFVYQDMDEIYSGTCRKM